MKIEHEVFINTKQ